MVNAVQLWQHGVMPAAEAHVLGQAHHLHSGAKLLRRKPFARAVRRGVVHQCERKRRVPCVLHQRARGLCRFFPTAVHNDARADLCLLHNYSILSLWSYIFYHLSPTNSNGRRNCL